LYSVRKDGCTVICGCRSAPPPPPPSAPSAPLPPPPSDAAALAAGGYHVLDRALFARELPVWALRLPLRSVASVSSLLAHRALRLPRVKSVIYVPGGDASGERLLLLAPAPAADGGAALPAGDGGAALLAGDGGAALPAGDGGAASPALAGAAGASSPSSGAGSAAAALPAPVCARSHGCTAGELSSVLCPTVGAALVPHAVSLGYAQLSMEEVLRPILGAGGGPVPASFEVVGRLAHLNLRPEHERFKYTVAAVLLDKNPSIGIVVNKTGALGSDGSAFRTFPMEVLAGGGGTTVEVRHVGARFRFDFRAVYWNSRLSHEHEHVARAAVPPGAVVADLFAGVGPFAVPLAAERGGRAAAVHANDLNPASHAALIDNARANGAARRLRAYNLDARAFVRGLARARVPFTHALMNLPADAVGFLDAFVDIFAQQRAAAAPDAAAAATAAAAAAAASPSPLPLPRIFCYAFCKTHVLEDAVADVSRRVLAALRLAPADAAPFDVPCYDAIGQAALAAGDARAPSAVAKTAVPPAVHAAAAAARAAVRALAAAALPDLAVREVRNVAPNKLMVCAEFTLPAAAAYARAPLARADDDAADAAADAVRAAEAAHEADAAAQPPPPVKRPRAAAAGAAAAPNAPQQPPHDDAQGRKL